MTNEQIIVAVNEYQGVYEEYKAAQALKNSLDIQLKEASKKFHEVSLKLETASSKLLVVTRTSMDK